MFFVFHTNILSSPFSGLKNGYNFAKSIMAPPAEPIFVVHYERKLARDTQSTMEMFNEIGMLKSILKKNRVDSVYLIDSAKVGAITNKTMHLLDEVKESVVILEDVQLRQIVCRTTAGNELAWLVSKAKSSNGSDIIVYRR